MTVTMKRFTRDSAAQYKYEPIEVSIVEAASKVAELARKYGKPETVNVQSAKGGSKFTFRPFGTDLIVIEIVGASVEAMRNAARGLPRIDVATPVSTKPSGFFVCVYCDNVCESRGALVCNDCTEDEIDFELSDALKPALMLSAGTYTLTYLDGTYFTFRVREVKTGSLTGKTIVEYLSGPDNSLDFTAFAMLHTDTINVWKKYEGGDLVNRAREIEAMARNDAAGLEAAGLLYAERSSRCRRCNKVLTVSASIGAGYGPDCAEILGIPYGQNRPVSGDSKKSRRKSKKEGSTAPAVEYGFVASTADDLRNFAAGYEDERADAYDRKHFRGEPGFGLA